jgi:hypothetical protein
MRVLSLCEKVIKAYQKFHHDLNSLAINEATSVSNTINRLLTEVDKMVAYDLMRVREKLTKLTLTYEEEHSFKVHGLLRPLTRGSETLADVQLLLETFSGSNNESHTNRVRSRINKVLPLLVSNIELQIHEKKAQSTRLIEATERPTSKI